MELLTQQQMVCCTPNVLARDSKKTNKRLVNSLRGGHREWKKVSLDRFSTGQKIASAWKRNAFFVLFFVCLLLLLLLFSSYSTSNKFLLVARHTLTTGLQKSVFGSFFNWPEDRECVEKKCVFLFCSLFVCCCCCLHPIARATSSCLLPDTL